MQQILQTTMTKILSAALSVFSNFLILGISYRAVVWSNLLVDRRINRINAVLSHVAIWLSMSATNVSHCVSQMSCLWQRAVQKHSAGRKKSNPYSMYIIKKFKNKFNLCSCF